ncbi:PTS system glucose-specific transporter subunit IIB (plasmid) [Mycoplasmopsis gallopavonis]|uniref:PTS system glucose-specific transporter subunit IIB n=2 Tax=Mycoplasmopsis gallopavonis TaxID=76629 RepID=A0A449B058_9BACT|nr:PTS system glucose-specific transporter subunit IIB [Mycoplasmopsis gallopavonis]
MIFLTIITFGLIWIFWNKQTQHQKNTFYQVSKIPFKIENLKEFLGSVTNILSVETKPSRVIIQVKDITKVNLIAIRDLKAVSGIFAKSDSLSIILGEFSQAVAKELNNDLTAK